MSLLFEREEHEFKRDEQVEDEKVHITFKEAEITWGYRVKQAAVSVDNETKQNETEQVAEKVSIFGNKMNVDIVSSPVFYKLDLNLKYGDFLAVVGKGGCGKTTLLYSILQET